MESSISNASPLLLLLLLLSHSSNARLTPDGVDVPRVDSHDASPSSSSVPSSDSHDASPSSSSFSSASSSLYSSSLSALQKDGEEGDREAKEEVLLSCIVSNMEFALLQAKITREKINEFKDSYAWSKFEMSWADISSIIPWEWDEGMLEVCSVDQTCSTVLPSLPPATTPPPATDSDAAKTLSEITNHVFRFTYAFEQLALDQAMNEDIFGEEMNDALNNHNQLSMTLEQVLETCGLAANDSALSSLHGKMYVAASDPQTDLRGFSTLRQSLSALDLLESMFGERDRL